MRIFVSYRREDSSPWAGRLRDLLATKFGEKHVFQDIETVGPGERFADAVDAAIARSDAVLVVIGPRWLTVAGPSGALRLADRGDYVHREVRAAIEHDKLIVPVLVGGASMPSPDELPSELASLATRQAITLHDETWHDDGRRLLRALDEGSPRSARRVVLALGLGALLAVAAGVVWMVASQRGDDRTSGASTTVAGSATTPASVEPASCPTPRGSGWTPVPLAGRAPSDAGASWRLEVVAGAYHEVQDHWQIVLETEATNLAVGSNFLYPSYSLALDGTSHPATCFQIVDGQRMVDPGRSSHAYVGFDVPQRPTGALALDYTASGESYRIDVAEAASS